MAEIKTYLSNRLQNAQFSPQAQLQFHILSAISKINTAIFVKVTRVDEVTNSSQPTGWVTVKQLVKDFNNEEKSVESVELFHLPYFRYQGGKCAIVTDPCVGDIGIALFAQNDSSNIKQGSTDEVTVGSFRTFSRSDGLYIGGFLNKKPEVYIELLQNGKIVIKSQNNATDAIILQGNTTIKGNLCVEGKIDTTGDITANTISLKHHTHGGVDRGGSNTDEPNAN